MSQGTPPPRLDSLVETSDHERDSRDYCTSPIKQQVAQSGYQVVRRERLEYVVPDADVMERGKAHGLASTLNAKTPHHRPTFLSSCCCASKEWRRFRIHLPADAQDVPTLCSRGRAAWLPKAQDAATSLHSGVLGFWRVERRACFGHR